MLKLLIPVSLFALIAFCPSTPTLAASDATDISAARKRFSVAPRVRVHRAAPRRAAVRSSVRFNRVASRSFRAHRGVTSARFISRSRYGGYGTSRFVARSAAFGVVPTVALSGNRYATAYRGSRRIHWGGRWRSYVPLAALGAVAVGGAYYYPDAYLSVARPYCEGATPDGCRLNWQMVGFEDGGGEGGWQCVQYCPRPGAAPPTRSTALTESSSSASLSSSSPSQGTCEITIYSAPRFASTAVPTSDDQPKLSESGWQNQIASLEIKAGTWEIFTEEQFNGNAMRLPPGSYPELEPEWTKKINSFMCIEPSN